MLEKIETKLSWQDLVLNNRTFDQVKEIEKWLNPNKTLLFNKKVEMDSGLKPSSLLLFAGETGTGKTMTASLLGKYTDRAVYRIKMSQIVSKYIGETEKNLSRLFEKVENTNSILFFDEADALFGKRTEIKDAHDRYANLETSYFLQRVATFSGLTILSTNTKKNIDQAIKLMFHAIIEFDRPTFGERKILWKKNLPENIPLEKTIRIDEFAKNHKFTGGQIVNAIQYARIKMMEKGENEIKRTTLLEGISKEHNSD